MSSRAVKSAWFHGLTPKEAIARAEERGEQLVDLAIEQHMPRLWSVVMTADAKGDCLSRTKAFTALTAEEVTSVTTAERMRLLVLKPYQDGSEGLRFDGIMIDNTTPGGKVWWWDHSLSIDAISQRLTEHNARLTDIHSYMYGDARHWSVVMVENPDNAQWWWFTDISNWDLVDKHDALDARSYDFDVFVDSTGSRLYSAILVPNSGAVSGWSWWQGLTEAEMTAKAAEWNSRLSDIEVWQQSDGPRFAALMIFSGMQ